jgi:5-methylcytosine-specific restriction endonuclease McrBC GTP-binding regulatory subunit McrB
MDSNNINIALEKFINNLIENDIQLETPKSKKIFNISTNEKKHIIIKPLEGTSSFPIPKKAIKNYIYTGSPTHPVYIVSIGNYIRNNYMDETVIVLNKDNQSLFTIKNIILYGIAGVGKTHNTNKLISLIEKEKSDKEIFETIKNNELSDSIDISDIKERVKFITFHQSFGYEDFIEGFRPNKEGNIVLIDGIFKEICKEAIEDKQKNYYLVIDEINRGNISKIFGELITLIEENKRDKLEITLPYSKELFKIPSNLYIIGTMNSTDKSIALIDIALRRRFTFLKMKPNASLINYSKAKKIFENLNQYILNTLGEDYQIGHSYFMDIGDENDLEFVLEYKIKPLLEEYFYGDIEGFKKAIDVIKEAKS